MSDTNDTPSPEPNLVATDHADDLVLPFQTDRGGALGRVVKLSASVNEILNRHDYPEPVARVLGEALALTAMLATTLKVEGRMILQTSTDGPLKMLVVNFDTPSSLRGYASFDTSMNDSAFADLTPAQLLGKGHLALTVDPGGNLDRYQGVVALDNETLTSAARTYFHQSEQLPTYLRLAVARQLMPGNPPTDAEQQRKNADDAGNNGKWLWRAGGLLVQHIAREGGTSAPGLETPEHGDEDETENWNRTRLLAATVEDHELIDPTLPSEKLLFRLFHEEDVRVTQPFPIEARCRCSRDRVEAFVKNFKDEELSELREPDGGVTVTCEFCNAAYRFDPGDV